MPHTSAFPSFGPLKLAAFALIASVVLSGCATTRSGGGRGPDIARDPQYNSGNLRAYTIRGRTYYPRIPSRGDSQTGTASWYSEESPNATTANGERFEPDGISAAHKTFPLPSIAEVTNLDNGKTIRLRVNDRGPFVDNRVMDLSRGAAKALGVYQTGTAKVKIVWLGPAEPTGSVRADPLPSRVAESSGRFKVQLGAFSDRSNADRAQDRMRDTRIEKRGQLYIVYLGPYNSPASAETHRQEAISAGFASAILVRAD